MCGFAGFIGAVQNPHEFLSQSISALARRGPDGHGYEFYGWSGLAHTRLSLIDLSECGKQPMAFGEYSIVFNGEIYNWKEIRQKLKKYAVQFVSQSDTEVLLHSIIHFGIDETLKSIRGIFAFAFLDRAKKELYLVRDRTGTKPLYYSHADNTLKFSSTLKSAFGAREICKSALEEYMTFQNILPPRTLFRGIYTICPGTYIKYSLSLDVIEHYEWSNLRIRERNTFSLQDNLQISKSLLIQAIRRNLVADVPVGAFLSGGLDSGLIAAIASEFTDQVRTFSIGFHQDETVQEVSAKNEVEEARALAAERGVENRFYMLEADHMWNSISEIAQALEEPRVGQSYPNFYAALLASRTSKAVMAGTGGDEFFGGYPWRYHQFLTTKAADKSSQVESMVHFWHRLASSFEISQLLNINHMQHHDFTHQHIASILNENVGSSSRYSLRDLMYFDMRLFLHGLLHVEDRLSMWHGLEVRVPFLDDDLVDFSLTIPSEFLVRELPNGELQGKVILREMALGMGLGIANRKKQGFSGPDAVWFQDSGKVSLFLPRSARIWEYLNFNKAQNILSEHFARKRNARLLIWSLIQLEKTLEQL